MLGVARLPTVPQMLLVVAVVLCLLGPLSTTSRADEGDEGLNFGTGVKCRPGRCGVGARSKARASRPVRPGKPMSRRAALPSGRGPAGPPTAKSTGWDFDLGDGMGILPRFDAETPKPRKNSQAPKPDPEALAQQAVRELVLPEPAIRTSPDEDWVQVVHVPTWMWVEKGGWKEVTTTASVPGVTVTAVARPRQAVWSTGDGASVVCRGPGTPYSSRFRAEASSPDCGHIYQRASPPGGAYRVSVRVVWDVEWRGGGRSGVVPGLTTRASQRLVVDEVQAVVTR